MPGCRWDTELHTDASLAELPRLSRLAERDSPLAGESAGELLLVLEVTRRSWRRDGDPLLPLLLRRDLREVSGLDEAEELEGRRERGGVGLEATGLLVLALELRRERVVDATALAA